MERKPAMTVEHYKNVVIGSGEGGKYLAWHLSQSGQQVAVIERRWIGGSCPNINCLPSKNVVWSARVAFIAQHANMFGISPRRPPSDMRAVHERKRRMVEGLITTNLDHYKSSTAELVMGDAKFTGRRTIQVALNEGGTRTLKAERIFLNLGTRASIPPVPGLAEALPLTNIEILELDRLPEHLIVLGGGYVGLEFAQAFRRFGSRVTILHRGSRLLTNQDEDVADSLLESFLKEGINVIAISETLSVRGRSGSGVSLLVRTAAGEMSVAGSDILVATGRVPNTSAIGLENAGVEADEQGYVKVDDRLQTTAAGIWAIGECAGSPQFTHISFDDFRVIRDNLAGIERSTNGRLVPSCLFTDPPVSQIGLTEDEALYRGIPVRVVKLPMSAVLRTRTLDETHGFMKALIEAEGDRILGFSMIGPEAGEVMAVVQVAMLAGLPYSTLRDAVFTHPTMAEGLVFLFSELRPRC
jgi:pyruvate/2-oxoglutarate dehydrogenase complex dihydrolipoamide dehydrogenase (E3) component